eukprot:3933813-Rhodomonas_salina.1
MPENPSDPAASRHIDTWMYFLRTIVRQRGRRLHQESAGAGFPEAPSLPLRLYHQVRPHRRLNTRGANGRGLTQVSAPMCLSLRMCETSRSSCQPLTGESEKG